MLVATADAADVVLYAGLTADQAARRASVDGNVPIGELRPVTLTASAMGRAPQLVGTGAVMPCLGAPEPADLRAVAKRIVSDILAGEDEAALRELEAAIPRLACAREPLVAEDVARL